MFDAAAPVFCQLASGILYSPEDADFVAAHSWYVQKAHDRLFYAYTYLYREGDESQRRRRLKRYLHRLIVQPPPDLLVDHRDGNGLNCCRWNLRIASHSNNSANRINRDLPLSGYRGVDLNGRRYRARITCEGVEHHLGMYLTAREAAEAYDAKARELFGEFAWLNFDERFEAGHAAMQQAQSDLVGIPF